MNFQTIKQQAYRFLFSVMGFLMLVILCAAADGSQRLLSKELAYDDRISRVVQLLEECSEEDGEEESQKLLPDHSFRDSIDSAVSCSHRGQYSLPRAF